MALSKAASAVMKNLCFKQFNQLYKDTIFKKKFDQIHFYKKCF